jgi:hypothetical protein
VFGKLLAIISCAELGKNNKTCIPIQTLSHDKARYFTTYINDHLTYTFIYLFKSNSDVVETFIIIKTFDDKKMVDFEIAEFNWV